MAFNNYLEDENDKPYFTTNSLAYYYDKMEGFSKAVEGSAKALNLTKEEVEKRLTLYIQQNKNELDQRLAQWDGKLETFDSSVETLLTEWVDDGTLTPLIDSTLIDQKIAPVTAKLSDKVEKDAPGVITYAMASQDFREQITGGNTAVVGVDAVLEENIVDGAVSAKKTDFIEMIQSGLQSKDISNQFTEVGRISTINGTLNATSTDDRATPFINVKDAEFIFRYVLDGKGTGKFTAYHIAFYNENEVFISGWNPATAYELEVYDGKNGVKYLKPEGAKLARMSMPATNVVGGTGNDYNYVVVSPSYTRRLKGDMNTAEIQRVEGFATAEIQRIDAELSGVNNKSHLQDKKIACFGDSIFGNFRDGTAVTDAMIEQTGATVYNFGFGGTTMAIRDGTNPQDVYWNEFSMTRIADYIASGDFTPLDAAIAGMNSPLTYFAGVIAELKTTNWNEIDIITLEHGTNDFSQGIPAKDEQDLLSRETYYGAYVYAVEKILTAYPHLKIVMLTPSWRFWRDGSTYIDGSDTYEIAGQTMLSLVDAVYNVRDVHHIPVINNYHDTNFNKFTRDIYFQDGVHLNAAGRKALGERVGHMLLSIL